MSTSCRDFRDLLAGRLAGRAAPERLAALAWHEHLFGCGACRTLLDDEEALESLLASLPEPRLSPEQRERVLARLRRSLGEELADARLDRLLDVAGADAAPAGLARGVVAGVARRIEDERLDRLLARDVVAAPADLAQWTLVGLRLARRASARRQLALRGLVALAAAAALAAIVWIAKPDASARVEDTPRVVRDVAPVERPGARETASLDAVPDEVLAALDVLENWDVLVTDDAETQLAPLPTADEALLDVLEEEG